MDILLGRIFGIAVAAFFVGNNDMLHITALSELYLDSLLEVLPIGLVNDAKELQKNEKDAIDYDSFRGAAREIPRYHGCPSDHNDSRCHKHWFGELVYGGRVKAIL